MNTIKALIADDERLGRDLIQHMLATHPDVDVISECHDGADALSKIEQHQPDLVFLDIKMPEISGIDVVNRLNPLASPIVVFITAHDRYALNAFDQNAVDYLLKPFDQERFDRMLDRVRTRVTQRENSEFAERIQNMIANNQDASTQIKPLRKITIKESNRVFFVDTKDVDYFEASGNYVAIHTGPKTHLLYESLGNMETKLDPEKFARVHRSTIINIESIKELRTHFNGEYVVVLKDDTRLKISRSYREKVKPLLGLD